MCVCVCTHTHKHGGAKSGNRGYCSLKGEEVGDSCCLILGAVAFLNNPLPFQKCYFRNENIMFIEERTVRLVQPP